MSSPRGEPAGGLRIGMVCPYDWSVPGGVRQHIADLSEQLRVRGNEVTILTPASDHLSLPTGVVAAGSPVGVPFNGSVARIAFDPSAFSRTREWLRAGRFDLLHVHEPASPSLAGIACWCATGPIVATFHASHEYATLMRTFSPLIRTALDKVTARIAVSAQARVTLLTHLGAQSVVIPNGVTIAHFAAGGADTPDCRVRRPAGPASDGPAPHRATDGGTGALRILFLGRLDEPRKGLEVLMAALPEVLAGHPALTVQIAGPGDPGDVPSHLDRRWAHRVQWLGEVSDAEKAALFASATIYVAPNTGRESFGIVLLEAMAAGAGIVASDLPAFRDVLDGGRCGLLVPVGEPAALARGLNLALSDVRGRTARIAAGRQRVLGFDWSVVTGQILDVYASVMTLGGGVQEDLRGQLYGRVSPTGRRTHRQARRTVR